MMTHTCFSHTMSGAWGCFCVDVHVSLGLVFCYGKLQGKVSLYFIVKILKKERLCF